MTDRLIPAHVFAFLNRLAANGFFGLVALRFENGVVVNIKKEQSLLPSSLTEIPENSIVEFRNQ